MLSFQSGIPIAVIKPSNKKVYLKKYVPPSVSPDLSVENSWLLLSDDEIDDIMAKYKLNGVEQQNLIEALQDDTEPNNNKTKKAFLSVKQSVDKKLKKSIILMKMINRPYNHI